MDEGVTLIYMDLPSDSEPEDEDFVGERILTYQEQYELQTRTEDISCRLRHLLARTWRRTLELLPVKRQIQSDVGRCQ